MMLSLTGENVMMRFMISSDFVTLNDAVCCKSLEIIVHL